MPDGSALAGAILQLATAGVATYGAVRCMKLQRFGSDSRLKALAWFFALFAGALVLQAAWQIQVGAGPPPFMRGLAGNGTAPAPGQPGQFPFFHPEGNEQVNIVLTLSHALMLASLTVGVWAFGHRRKPGSESNTQPVAGLLAAVPMGFAAVLDDIVPLMLALEAGLALYLAARALINHVERRSSGALQVALGFLFFFVAHLVIYLAHQPGGGHDRLGDVLGLVGIVLLVQVLPQTR